MANSNPQPRVSKEDVLTAGEWKALEGAIRRRKVAMLDAMSQFTTPAYIAQCEREMQTLDNVMGKLNAYFGRTK